MKTRKPPQNIEYERAVIGAIMIDNDILMDIGDGLHPDHFYDKRHQEIFGAIRMLEIKNEPIDILTVSENLKIAGKLDAVGGVEYLAGITDIVPSITNATIYAKIIREKALLRSLIKASGEIIDACYDEGDVDMILDFAEQKVFELAEKNESREFVHIRDVITENINKLDQLIKNEGKIDGISTGFKNLDAKLGGGLRNSELVIVAARPGMGKTAFVLSMMREIATKQDATALLFSLEMPNTQIGERLLSAQTSVQLNDIKVGKLKDREWNDLMLGNDVLSQTGIYLDDTPGITLTTIKNKCRRLKAKRGLDLVIVDYLQLMESVDKTENRVQELSKLTRGLKLMARELECPVIVLSQLSRGVDARTDHRPLLSDLRESGSIEQDADIVMFLYREGYYEPESIEKQNICDVMIAKNRNGDLGRVTMSWLGQYTRFGELSGYDMLEGETLEDPMS